MSIYLSGELAKDLASFKVIFDHRVSLLVVLGKDLLDIGQFLCLEGVDPVGESNGIVYGAQGSGTSSRIQLLELVSGDMVSQHATETHRLKP